ncbi:MAG: transglutaminase domain-containing protein [Spirochaetaceae bacterium]
MTDRSSRDELRPGSYVTLPVSGSRRKAKGLVRALWEEGEQRYLELYSYRTRRVTTYRLTRRGRLKKLEPEAIPGSAASSEPEEPGELRARLPLVLLLVSVGILLVLIVPLLQGGFRALRVSMTSYESFLEREMSFSKLVSTVATRVDYRRDLDEYWSPPAGVWGSRSGDCEDHAMVVAAYLRHHGVPYTIFGLALGEELQGHVAVVAETEKGPVLLDPTLATASDGVERFPKGTPLREIVGRYGTLPGTIYPDDPEPGRPKPEGIIE